METRPHIPVLPAEVLLTLSPKPGRIIVDCTLGLGGHSAEILRRILPGGTLIAMDFDPASIAIARERLSKIPRSRNRFHIFQNNFAALPTALAEAGVDKVDGILADLGVSSPQIDDPARGFSYRQKGPLDMRMDPARGRSAADLVNTLPEKELAAALLELGDEEDAAQIARLIIDRRKIRRIETTQELSAVVCQARRFTMERAAGAKLHPAARTFQALRILVNRELPNLERLLAVAPQVLAPGGVVAIISFHSGEDRMVKRSFRAGIDEGVYSQISYEPIRAEEAEIAANSRARSAKLRWAKRA
jgi:16S rRNA (cytosine1402-N4)-methyltransferase